MGRSFSPIPRSDVAAVASEGSFSRSSSEKRFNFRTALATSRIDLVHLAAHESEPGGAHHLVRRAPLSQAFHRPTPGRAITAASNRLRRPAHQCPGPVDQQTPADCTSPTLVNPSQPFLAHASSICSRFKAEPPPPSHVPEARKTQPSPRVAIITVATAGPLTVVVIRPPAASSLLGFPLGSFVELRDLRRRSVSRH